MNSFLKKYMKFTLNKFLKFVGSKKAIIHYIKKNLTKIKTNLNKFKEYTEGELKKNPESLILKEMNKWSNEEIKRNNENEKHTLSFIENNRKNKRMLEGCLKDIKNLLKGRLNRLNLYKNAIQNPSQQPINNHPTNQKLDESQIEKEQIDLKLNSLKEKVKSLKEYLEKKNEKDLENNNLVIDSAHCIDEVSKKMENIVTLESLKEITKDLENHIDNVQKYIESVKIEESPFTETTRF